MGTSADVTTKPCADTSPSWFTGRWQDWHRGHGCDRDDGRPRSPDAITEIAQHAANEVTGHLTDAELRVLRAATTSGNDLLIRALDELKERRATDRNRAQALAAFDHSQRTEKHFEPLLGYCVCEDCQKLPAHARPSEAP
jgi:hypothetical protein